MTNKVAPEGVKTETKTKKRCDIFGLFKSALTNITVEPCCFLFALSYGLFGIVSSELYIQKVCRVNLALGDEMCDNIQQHKEEQVQVQKYVSTLKIYNTVLQVIVY